MIMLGIFKKTRSQFSFKETIRILKKCDGKMDGWIVRQFMEQGEIIR